MHPLYFVFGSVALDEGFFSLSCRSFSSLTPPPPHPLPKQLFSPLSVVRAAVQGSRVGSPAVRPFWAPLPLSFLLGAAPPLPPGNVDDAYLVSRNFSHELPLWSPIRLLSFWMQCFLCVSPSFAPPLFSLRGQDCCLLCDEPCVFFVDPTE